MEFIMKFTDESCFSCGRKFNENDDVVVCPECGTPYHRDCYNHEGKCVNAQLHESGGKWRRKPVSEQSAAKDEAGRICPKCMHRNDENAEICRGCGCRLPDKDGSQHEDNNGIGLEAMFGNTDNAFFKPYLGLDPDEDLGGATVRELSVFVDSNTLYYLPLFKKMKDFGSRVSLNVASFLFPYFYFANRKMWFWGIVTAVVSVLLELPSTLYTLATTELELPYIQNVIAELTKMKDSLLLVSEGCAIAGWIFRIIVCMFANRLYFRFAVRSINKIKESHGGFAESAVLKAKGGVNPSNMLFMLLILIGISFAISLVLLITLSAVQQIMF